MSGKVIVKNKTEITLSNFVINPKNKNDKQHLNVPLKITSGNYSGKLRYVY